MIAKRFRQMTFRMQIALLFGGIIVVLIVVLSTLLGRMQASSVREHAGNAMQMVANNAQRVLAIGLHNRLMIVQGLASSPTLWKQGLGSETVVNALVQQQTTSNNVAWMGVAGTDGFVRAATSGLLLGVNVAARPWFAAGLRGVHVGDVHEALLLAKLLPPSSTGEPQRFVDFAAPIRVDGQVRGVVALHGGWDWTRNIVESQLPADAHALAMDLLIVDRKGIVIYAPLGHDREQIKLGDDLGPMALGQTKTATIHRWPDGNEYLTSVARLEPREPASDLGWLIVSRAPMERAYAPVRHAVLAVVGIGLVAAAIAMFLAWLVAGSISDALSSIERGAKEVLSGTAGATIPACEHNAELASLSHTLIDMTQTLETKVRERDHLARFDPLTRILNRRGFEEQAATAIVNAKRRGATLSIIAIDVDHFKRVNDEHGHDVGDAVLQTLATLLKMRFRESDVVARMGGEEFLVLLQDTDVAAASRVADSLVEHVAASTFPGVDRVTISCGVARLGSGETAPVAMKRADRALYRAKESGRNQSFIFAEEVAA